MKFITKYVLITIAVFRAAHEVQGKANEIIMEKERDQLEKGTTQVISNTKETGETITEKVLNYEHLIRHNKPGYEPFETKPNNSEENTLTSLVAAKNFDYDNITQAKHKMLPLQNDDRAEKSCNTEISIKTPENVVIKPPVPRSLPFQRIYCRQTIKTEINDQGKIIETIQQNCAPLTTTAAPPRPTLPLFKREKNCEPSLTATPKGINCRRVMNSELNDLGEIVDSVTEICDPPTTTTTTTRKPILYTWPRTTIPTAKPLVKVCTPVMDSYLSEEGKIIDSVVMLCKMKQID